ncbi:MAG TPA: SDR family NAD(P)-dependent oxidoreductase, partial [Acinetobacter johnsonii]|nr:SDR family NAD(P)-dependent oxidoreductase [Acinetobacter johnsonii]
MHIKNQVVLVTGGARGLGLAITHALINEGARVVVNYLNSQVAAQTLVQQYPEQVFIYQADVTDNAQVKSMF